MPGGRMATREAHRTLGTSASVQAIARLAGSAELTGSAQKEPRDRIPWWQEIVPTPAAAVIALVVCVVAPAVLVGAQIDANPKFSPIDEAAHYDYLNRVAEGEIPRQGERLTTGTLREIACKGNAFNLSKLPPCSARTLRPDDFPGRGYQYEAQHPPTYHVITVPIRWGIQHVLGVSDRLDATRAAGIVWLAAGLLLAWAAGRIMGLSPITLGAVLLLLATAPSVIFFYGTVSTDVTAVTAGGAVALAGAIAYRRAAGAPVLLLVVGVFAAACKVTNMFAVVIVSAAFVAAAIVARADGEAWRDTFRRWMRDGGVLLAGGVVTSVLWAIIHRSIALISLRDEPAYGGLRGGSQALGPVLEVATTFLRPITDEVGVELASGATLGQDAQRPIAAMIAFLLIAGGLAGLFTSQRRWYHVVGLISVPALYVGGVVLGLGFMLAFDTDAGGGVSGRYAMSAAPLLLIVLGASLRGKWAVGTVGALSITSLVVTLAVLVS
jgi:hypothetical protein